MSFKEITLLRKSGKLEEALQMAFDYMKKANEKNSIVSLDDDEIINVDKKDQFTWPKRALAWVYFEYLKKYRKNDLYEKFKENLNHIKDLDLASDEYMIFDSVAFQVALMVFEIKKNDPLCYSKMDELFNIIKTFNFTKPSKEYSLILKAFIKNAQKWSNLSSFLEWWNLDNLEAKDYLMEEFDGIKVMSLAEQSYIAYSKKLLEGETNDISKYKNTINKDKVNVFLPKLDMVIEKNPSFMYPSYFKAKLLLAIGDNKDLLPLFLSFAKKKKNEFWIWQLMSEIFPNDKETQFACYCRALSLNTSDEYIVNVRKLFSNLLIEKRMFNEAKTEILKIIAISEKKAWKLSSQILDWVKQEWYLSAIAKKDNKDLYFMFVNKALDILYSDLPIEYIVVEFVNEKKGILNFVKDKENYGVFNYLEHIKNPKIGDVLKVRFNGVGKNGFYKIATASLVDNCEELEAIKSFEGELTIVSPFYFGFVKDVYIDSKFIEKKSLNERQNISGKAIMSFNKKKQVWGWKAFDVSN